MYILKKRVRFYETDGMCVVYHGNYLKWFEEARVEYMREGGGIFSGKEEKHI